MKGRTKGKHSYEAHEGRKREQGRREFREAQVESGSGLIGTCRLDDEIFIKSALIRPGYIHVGIDNAAPLLVQRSIRTSTICDVLSNFTHVFWPLYA